MEPITNELTYPPIWLEAALDIDDVSIAEDEVEEGNLGYI